MHVINIFFLLTLAFTGVITHPVRNKKAKIFASVGEFPYQVLIRLRYEYKYPICNGIILTPEYVLTTATCIKRYITSPQDLQLMAGGLTSNMTSFDSQHVQENDVKSIFPHPTWYISDGKSDDLALLEVSPNFKETSYVRPAHIKDFELTSINICGWGESEDLTYLEGQIYDEDTCEKLLKYKRLPSTFCVGKRGSRTLLPTQEYAGAAVSSDNKVYGIVSSKPGTAIIISDYKKWIESIIGKTVTTNQPRSTTIESKEKTNSKATEGTKKPFHKTTPQVPTEATSSEETSESYETYETTENTTESEEETSKSEESEESEEPPDISNTTEGETKTSKPSTNTTENIPKTTETEPGKSSISTAEIKKETTHPAETDKTNPIIDDHTLTTVTVDSEETTDEKTSESQETDSCETDDDYETDETESEESDEYEESEETDETYESDSDESKETDQTGSEETNETESEETYETESEETYETESEETKESKEVNEASRTEGKSTEHTNKNKTSSTLTTREIKVSSAHESKEAEDTNETDRKTLMTAADGSTLPSTRNTSTDSSSNDGTIKPSALESNTPNVTPAFIFVLFPVILPLIL